MKLLKWSVLTLFLLIPILIYLFLINFGKNHYELPVYYEEGLPIEGKGNDGKQHYIPAFSFINQDRKTVTEKDLKGKIYVAKFFFVTCPGICPKMSSQVQRVQQYFEKDKDVMFVSFTVNPENDTPEVLKEYANEHQAISGKWHFLTGDKQEIYDLARYGFALAVVDSSLKNPDAFIHSEKLVLVDKKSRIRGYYDGTERKDVDRLITEIQLLKELEN
jgi:protein SCO1/2